MADKLHWSHTCPYYGVLGGVSSFKEDEKINFDVKTSLRGHMGKLWGLCEPVNHIRSFAWDCIVRIRRSWCRFRVKWRCRSRFWCRNLLLTNFNAPNSQLVFKNGGQVAFLSYLSVLWLVGCRFQRKWGRENQFRSLNVTQESYREVMGSLWTDGPGNPM